MVALIMDDIFDKYRGDSTALISMLNDIQKKYKYLPMEALEQVSKKLHVSLAKIYGIITFYSHYKLNKPGKVNIKICHGTACYVKNAEMITNALKFDYDIIPNKTTEDGLFSLEHVSCIGACALAPTLEINGEIHGEMDTKKIRKIINKIKRLEGSK
ncbi:MAG: NADP-reducing hydrogenase subunit HndA [Candidatus Heimdallarchaeota archaeon LC_3]|nr:MAG: NADP-reducing hydrogenase subunit HndA [Candidatus Heimdallarchaeota archaeon LC_3]